MSSTHRRKERIDRGIKVRTDGLYALMSWRELSYLTVPRLVLILGILALPIVMPGMYWQKVITIVCIYAMLAIGFDFLAHYVGLVSLGGAFFIGTGGYIAAILNSSYGLPPLLTIPIATILGAAICTLLLLPCLPLRGVYFAIVTLMYPLVLARIIEALDVLGGTDGIMGVDSFASSWVEQYLAVTMVLIFLFGLRRLVNTDIGLVFRAVKDNDQAVRASGMNISYYKAVAVFIASAMGCLAGACLVHIYMWAGISLFALDFSIIPIAATVIGGGGTIVGPVLGCLILVPISELLREFGTLRIVFYSLILVGFIVFRSEGIMVFGERKYHQFQRWVRV
ncbi:MAG: branched-chain amino acid ABC transporter permease [Deltaproteobacteria bacterium CG_4_8_14_3_um_filter_51_11]|nr:branched-chain amino acid ABC transporter permease [bacterium]OIP42842.1 MAG: branched-chain amino acid ABC transporter permease [Desulfobacteraceae bacterium CG2_30_51_40]PIP44870.1 MAG: branched-chain amino acid ABC transporter permease [Deltaproteobacteria bacterium CG23_combo_of_CG06-09_8_20_14_all_51_20]PIW00466.1 MAG: branched-chain amino acid ABC transporter permease [Deltaproteobacteria bacterium CG17_big_fil_post_rev_8_21_14_2_50_51_6]PIX18423.1 MAG: branched-chain amino acid ABC tr